MAEWLGWMGLLAAALGTLLLSVRHRSIAFALSIAFVVRAMAALIHFYIMPLPDGMSDAVTFERYAWEWAQGGFAKALTHFPGLDAYFYAWLMSLVYALTDRSLLLLQAINVFVGVLGVLVTWRLARELWGERTAVKAAWGMALFPMVVQYGALPIRETGFVLFLMLGLLGAVRWARSTERGGFGLAVVGFVVATFFHGGAFVALLAFIGTAGAGASRRWMGGLTRGKLPIKASLTILVVTGLMIGYVSSGVSIHKLGTAEEIINVERWFYYFESRVYGDARYPEWTQPESVADLTWAVPLRAAYLLFSPFPWDLREPEHLIGIIDGLFYLALVVLVWRSRDAIRGDPGARMLIFIIIPLIFAYGVGSGNFGTALRHRAKLVGALIVLAAPRLPYLSLSRGNRSQSLYPYTRGLDKRSVRLLDHATR